MARYVLLAVMRFTPRRWTVAATVIALIFASLEACGGEEGRTASGERAVAGDPDATEPAQLASAPPLSVTLPRGVSAGLPSGWQLLRKPINGVIEPVQVLAASSFPVRLDKPPYGGCRPARVLNQMPVDGALVQVIESTMRADGTPRPNLENFPPRQRPFRLPGSNHQSYECNGPSYNISFRDQRRGFQAFVWLDPNRGDPRFRRQALNLLNSLQFVGPHGP